MDTGTPENMHNPSTEGIQPEIIQTFTDKVVRYMTAHFPAETKWSIAYISAMPSSLQSDNVYEMLVYTTVYDYLNEIRFLYKIDSGKLTNSHERDFLMNMHEKIANRKAITQKNRFELIVVNENDDTVAERVDISEQIQQDTFFQPKFRTINDMLNCQNLQTDNEQHIELVEIRKGDEYTLIHYKNGKWCFV